MNTFVAVEDAHPLTREEADELCDDLTNGQFLFTDFYVQRIDARQGGNQT